MEEQLIQQFVQGGCKCDFEANKSPCCMSISPEHIQSVQCHMAEFTHDELDLVVMGQVMSGCFAGAKGRRGESPTPSSIIRE